MTDVESIVQKVAKLLDKAQSTKFEAEAEALEAKAEELMVRHAITQAMLQSRGDRQTDRIVKKNFRFTGQWASAQSHLCTCVAYGFGMKVVLHTGGNQPSGCQRPEWIGFESDVEAAELLLTSLLIQAMNALKEYTARLQKEYPGASTRELYKHRRAFIMGFADKICKRIKETRKKVTDEVTQESGTGMELVLVERDDQVQSQLEEWYPSLGKARRSNAKHPWSAIGAGARAGERADINQSRIGSRKGLNA